jgi:hypothetical protein
MKQWDHSMDEKIEAILKKYREALVNDEEFSVLKQIRDELKEVIQMRTSPMEEDLPPEKT